MTTRITNGPSYGGASRDGEAHRTYKLIFIVQSDVTDGPANVLQTPGLPLFGSEWIVDNDLDLWAWCRWDTELEPMTGMEPCTQWKVTFTFSTKPPEKNCKTIQLEDPLLEPPKISGSAVKYQEEASFDRNGVPIQTSSFEPIHGPQVEFDGNRDTIEIEQNVGSAILGYILPAQMRNTVNQFPLWGYPPRCIKLSETPWTLKFYGLCFAYYNRRLRFDTYIKVDPSTGAMSSGFDRDILDEGTKVLNGHWDLTVANGRWVLDPIDNVGTLPNPQNPQHFIKYTDFHGNPARIILNGSGVPAGVAIVGAQAYYVNPQNGTMGGSLTAPPWIAVVGTTSPPAWDSTVNYVPGNLVYDGLPSSVHVWIALNANINSPPSDLNANWSDLGPTPLSNQGIWKSTTTYNQGALVLNPLAYQGQGKIHVEKYAESDFLQLGIPASF